MSVQKSECVLENVVGAAVLNIENTVWAFVTGRVYGDFVQVLLVGSNI